MRKYNIRLQAAIAMLFCAYSLKSQIPIEAFVQALQSKQYATFKKTFQKALLKDSLIDYGNSLSRQIFDDYQEVWYEIFDNHLIGNTHSLKMIVKGNSIIYYHFSFVNIERQGEKRIFTTVPIDTFTDIARYSRFKASFRKVYQADLNETDLWVYSIVNAFCGLRTTQGNIKECDEMIALVDANKKDSLLQWLQSANLEKQMLGLLGYNELLKKKANLSNTELKLIKTILRKKAKAHVRGCAYCCFVDYLTPKEFVKSYHLTELPN